MGSREITFSLVCGKFSGEAPTMACQARNQKNKHLFWRPTPSIWQPKFLGKSPVGSLRKKLISDPGKPNELWGVTCYGLASHPGGVEILLATSCYGNQNKLQPDEPVWLQGFTSFYIKQQQVVHSDQVLRTSPWTTSST